jgi:hypothetical protein
MTGEVFRDCIMHATGDKCTQYRIFSRNQDTSKVVYIKNAIRIPL